MGRISTSPRYVIDITGQNGGLGGVSSEKFEVFLTKTV